MRGVPIPIRFRFDSIRFDSRASRRDGRTRRRAGAPRGRDGDDLARDRAMAVDEDDDEDARDEDGSIANSDALETRRRRTRDDDDGTTTTRTTTTMDARMRRARREHEKIARTYAEAHENVGTRENGTTRDADALRRERVKTSHLIAKVNETKVGANATLVRRKEYLDRMIANAEEREALMEDGGSEARGGGAATTTTRRDAPQEWTTMGQMAERKSPAKSLRERDARDFQPEKYRFDDEKASPSAAEAVNGLSRALDDIDGDLGSMSSLSPDRYPGRKETASWDTLARQPTSHGSRQLDAALGRAGAPEAKSTPTTISTYFKKSAGATQPTTTTAAVDDFAAAATDKSRERLPMSPPPPKRRAKSTRGDPASPMVVDLLETSDEENPLENESRGVQSLDPVSLTSENGEIRRSTRSSRYRSLQNTVGNLATDYPDSKTKGSVQITLGDLEHLRDGEMLNDQCVDFYLKYIQVEMLGANAFEILDKVHIFNSFFYQKLAQKHDRDRSNVDAATASHARVKNWTKGVDIFTKSFLMIPVHSNLHWSLVIVCYPNGTDERQPMMLHLDSMTQHGGHNSEVVSKTVRRYLSKEWKTQKGDDTESKFDARYMPTYRVNVPRQNNGCDCGVFILAFLEKFLTEQPEILKKSDVQRAAQKRSFGMDDAGKFLRKNWFPNEFVDELRAKLSLLVIQRIQASLAENDASKLILNAANEEQMKDYEHRQWRTKQAVSKAERDRKKRMEAMEAERRRKLEPQDLSDDDDAKTKASDAKDVDFEISREVRVKKQPTKTRQTQIFSGSHWNKAREKEPVREETRDEKPFEPFAGPSYKIGRHTRARAPSPSADWTSGTTRPKYGNANLLKRAERSRAKQNGEEERSAESPGQAKAKLNDANEKLSERIKGMTSRVFSTK